MYYPLTQCLFLGELLVEKKLSWPKDWFFSCWKNTHFLTIGIDTYMRNLEILVGVYNFGLGDNFELFNTWGGDKTKIVGITLEHVWFDMKACQEYSGHCHGDPIILNLGWTKWFSLIH